MGLNPYRMKSHSEQTDLQKHSQNSGLSSVRVTHFIFHLPAHGVVPGKDYKYNHQRCPIQEFGRTLVWNERTHTNTHIDFLFRNMWMPSWEPLVIIG